MAKKKVDKLKSARRFGPRYGRRVKSRFAAIEQEQRKKHKCPYCNNIQVKRISTGIWQCRKCNAKFTGKAYTLSKRSILKKESKEPSEEIQEETQEIEEVEETEEEVEEPEEGAKEAKEE